MWFEIRDDAVRRQAANLSVTVDELPGALQRYRAAVGALPGTWIGAGAEEFLTFEQRHQAASEGLVTSLRTIQAEMDGAGLDYARNEADQKAAVDALAAPAEDLTVAQDEPAQAPEDTGAQQDDGGLWGAIRRGLGWTNEQALGVFKGFGEGVVGLGQGLWMFAKLSPVYYLIDPEGFKQVVDEFGNAIEFAVEHPAEFGKAIINWEDLEEGRYGEWLGNLGPDALITIATLGGAGAGIASLRAARGADTVSDATRAANRAADAAAAASDAAQTLRTSQRRAIRSLERQVQEHRDKLEAYRQNPDAFDNKGRLAQAQTPEIRQKMVDGRIQKLEREIHKFEREIEKIRGSGAS